MTTLIISGMLIIAYFIHRKIFAQVQVEFRADPSSIKLKTDVANHSIASQILCIAAICLTLYSLATLNPDLSRDLSRTGNRSSTTGFKPVGR